MKHKLGLVFDGGGAKGAYQIGVWRALKELGLDKHVTDIAGTSVGGLNAALFIKGDLEEAEKIWSDEISAITPTRIQMGVGEIIDKHLGNMECFSNSNINCYIAAQKATGKENQEKIETASNGGIKKAYFGDVEYFNMRYVPLNDRDQFVKETSLPKSILLSTCALPVICDMVHIDEDKYLDAGAKDNSPVYALLAASKCDTIIIVHLNTEQPMFKKQGKQFEVNLKSFSNVSVLELIPSEDTGGFFKGTLNFKEDHAKQLMKLGYNDSIEQLRALDRNWKKAEQYYRFIQEGLTDDERYRLFIECEFLSHNIFAKLNYISEEGFGKNILKVINGSDKRAKEKILKNSAELHKNTLAILSCLDNKIFNIEQCLKNMRIFERDSLHEQYLRYLEIAEILNILNRMIPAAPQNYEEKKLFKEKMECFERNIYIAIEKQNAIDEEFYREYQKMLSEEKRRIKEARACSILRITPFEASVITKDGVDRSALSGEDTRMNKIESKTVENLLSQRDYSALIIPEGMENPASAKKVIFPADYFMFLWFENTRKKDRAGKCVCMMDYYDGEIYVYGYVVDDAGEEYSKFEFDKNKIRTIHYLRKKRHIRDDLKEMFGDKHNEKLLCYRTFSSTITSFEKRLDNKKYYTISPVEAEWEDIIPKNKCKHFIKFVQTAVKKQ